MASLAAPTVAIRTDDPERHARLAGTIARADVRLCDDPVQADAVLLDAMLPALEQEVRTLSWPVAGGTTTRCLVVADRALAGAPLVALLSAGLSGTLSWDIEPDALEELIRDVLAAGGTATGGVASPSVAECHRTAIEQLLARRQFEIVVQPIAELRGGYVLAVEALVRFGGETPRPPQVWLERAADVGMRVELELALAAAALDVLATLDPRTLLCVNVGAGTLLDDRLFELLATVEPSRIVLELSHGDLEDYEVVAEAAATLAERGVRLAVDDSGIGVHSLARLAQLHPAYLKIDRALVRDIDGDRARRALVRALIGFATEIGAEAIAEGVETPAEVACLRELGVHYAQGYLIAMPVSPSQLPPGPFPVLDAEAPRGIPEVLHTFELPRRAERDFHAAAHAVLGFLAGELPGESLVVTHLDFAGRRSGIIAAAGPAVAVLQPGTTLPLADVPEYWMVRGEGPRLCPDVARDPVYGALAVAQHPDFVSFMSVPLELPDGSRFGALSVASERRNAFERRDLAVLHGVAELLSDAAAQETAELHPADVARYLRRLAQTDAVTKTLNRPGFVEALGATVSRPAPGHTTRFLLRLRVLDLGSIIERFGRAVGDLVLRDIAVALQSATEAMDVVGRVGDKDLAVVLVGRGGRHDVDVVLHAVASRLAEGARKRDVTPSMDVGVVELTAGCDADGALRDAAGEMSPFVGVQGAAGDGLV